MKIAKVTSRLTETWDPYFASIAIWQVFISWEPPPLQYIKVNFDGSLRDSRGGASFVIYDPGL